jgi:hypothetical protein
MREQIAIAPIKWAPIKELQNVEPLNDADSEFLIINTSFKRTIKSKLFIVRAVPIVVRSQDAKIY